MRCPYCGQDTPDKIPNCINCGKLLDGNVDYQQLYYKNKVERQQNVKNSFQRVGDSVVSGVNKVGTSVKNGANKIENSMTNGINSFVTGPDSGTMKALMQKGDNAFIMGIVGMVLAILGGFTIPAFVLGIISLLWAKQAYPVTNKENHKNAKIFGIVAIVLSSLQLAAWIIYGILMLVGVVASAGAYLGEFEEIYELFDMAVKLI